MQAGQNSELLGSIPVCFCWDWLFSAESSSQVNGNYRSYGCRELNICGFINNYHSWNSKAWSQCPSFVSDAFVPVETYICLLIMVSFWGIWPIWSNLFNGSLKNENMVLYAFGSSCSKGTNIMHRNSKLHKHLQEVLLYIEGQNLLRMYYSRG